MILRSGPTHTDGFSLVELMVALAAGLIVSVALVAFLMSSFKSNSEYVQSTRLTQELRTSLDTVTRDLRRAGYDQNGMTKIANNVSSKFARILLSDEITPATSPKKFRCVIYGYDRPSQGISGCTATQGVVDQCNGEVRGIRLGQARTFGGRSIGVLEYAVSSGTTSPACGGAEPNYTSLPIVCDATSKWCALSDPTRLDISAFSLTDNRATVAVDTQLRDIEVSVTGRVAGSTEYVRTVASRVRIRSECFDATLSNCNTVPSN